MHSNNKPLYNKVSPSMIDKKTNPSSFDPFAEIIESSLDSFLAQSWSWDIFPTFGSLVEVRVATKNKVPSSKVPSSKAPPSTKASPSTKEKSFNILGCVTSVKTGSMDPLRYPFPYKKTEAELEKEQPQIFEFLKTTFCVKILGYQDEKKIHYTIPPTPAKIHSFVYNSSTKCSVDFFSNPDFLYLLFSEQNSITHFDDLLLSIFKNLKEQKQLSPKLIALFCKKFSLLTGNNYRRMKLFLQRVESVL